MKKLSFNSIVLFLTLSFSLFSDPIPVDVVIIGGGPAGLTAALYTARSGLSSVLLEGEEPGGQIALSYAVENFPGFASPIDGYHLIENMKAQATQFGGQIVSLKAEKIDFSKTPYRVESLGKVYEAKALIIATGASAKWLGLESEKKNIGKGVSSCAVCDGALYKNKEVIVVGGGDSAMEDALFLSRFAKKVTVVHRKDRLRASAHLQKKAFKDPKITFLWNTEVVDICSNSKGVSGAILKEGIKSYYQRADGIFIAIGHKPNTELFQGALELRDNGSIKTDPYSTKTSLPGVFAAGDVVDFRYRQAITAAASGCMAALDAYQYLQQLNPSDAP